jgi:hypothetical protein
MFFLQNGVFLKKSSKFAIRKPGAKYLLCNKHYIRLVSKKDALFAILIYKEVYFINPKYSIK